MILSSGLELQDFLVDDGAGRDCATAVFAHLCKSRWYKLNYYRRKLASLGEVKIECADEGNFAELFEAFLRLHEARWRMHDMPGYVVRRKGPELSSRRWERFAFKCSTETLRPAHRPPSDVDSGFSLIDRDFLKVYCSPEITQPVRVPPI